MVLRPSCWPSRILSPSRDQVVSVPDSIPAAYGAASPQGETSHSLNLTDEPTGRPEKAICPLSGDQLGFIASTPGASTTSSEPSILPMSLEAQAIAAERGRQSRSDAPKVTMASAKIRYPDSLRFSFFASAAALQYAEVFAQWGDKSQALQWFERAHELRDPGLIAIKVDPLLDPIRQEPRFQSILHSLNFPD